MYTIVNGLCTRMKGIGRKVWKSREKTFQRKNWMYFVFQMFKVELYTKLSVVNSDVVVGKVSFLQSTKRTKVKWAKSFLTRRLFCFYSSGPITKFVTHFFLRLHPYLSSKSFSQLNSRSTVPHASQRETWKVSSNKRLVISSSIFVIGIRNFLPNFQSVLNDESRIHHGSASTDVHIGSSKTALSILMDGSDKTTRLGRSRFRSNSSFSGGKLMHTRTYSYTIIIINSYLSPSLPFEIPVIWNSVHMQQQRPCRKLLTHSLFIPQLHHIQISQVSQI